MNDNISPLNPLLSVVLPVFEEPDTVAAVITKVVKIMTANHQDFEIIAVDDGSRGNTPDVLRKLQLEYSPVLRVISHPYNKGNGAAIRSGIHVARGEVIACLDADGQHEPEDIIKLLPLMKDYDLVVGARTETYQGSHHRNIANWFYNTLSSWLADFPIEDLTSGFRLFRASVVKKYVALFPARFSYTTTSTLVFLKGGYNVKFAPIHVKQRQEGKSKIRVLRDGWRFIMIIVKIVVLYEPLRIFLPVALMSFLLGALLTLINTACFTRGFYISNSSVVLFVLGIVVLLLGLLSEQITAVQVSLRHEE